MGGPGRAARFASAAADVGRRTWQRVGREDLALVSAGLTFYAGLAIVPLALFGVYGASLLLGTDRTTAILDDLSVYLVGPVGLDAVLRDITRIGPGLGLPSLVASLLTASAYGEGLLRAVQSYDRGRPRGGAAWRGRLLVIPYVLAFPGFVTAALLTGTAVQGALAGGLGAQLLGLYLAFLIGWVLLSLQLAFIYRAFATSRPSPAAVAWGSATAASFLAGMSLGWLPILRLGVDIGRAYGGSEMLGRGVLIAIYLLLFQLVLLVGQLLVTTIDERRDGG